MGDPKPRSALQTALDDMVAAACPGVILVIGAPGFEFSGASGLFERGGSRPLRPDDPFRAASVTKTVTAATAVKLASEGRWELDDPVSGYLSPCDVDQLRRFAGLENVDDLTLRRLLGHTSGLPDYFFHEGFQAKVKADPDRTWRPEELLEAAAEIGRLDFPPGSGFAYGDTGFVVTGLAIQELTGRPLRDVYRSLIFDPLGMNATWLEWHEARQGREISHHYDGDRDLLPTNTSFDWAGGGLVTTAGDLVRFLRGLFGGTLFEDRWLTEMTKWRGDLAWRPNSSARYLRYGLGIGQNEACGEEIVGATGVWGAFMYYWPRGDAAMAGTVNLVGSDRPMLFERVVRGLKDAGDSPGATVECNL